MRRSAFRMPRCSELAAILSSLARSSSRGMMLGPDPVGGESRVRHHQGAARVHQPGAFRACSPLPMGSGTNTAGTPTAATSQTVAAPARASSRSAAA